MKMKSFKKTLLFNKKVTQYKKYLTNDKQNILDRLFKQKQRLIKYEIKQWLKSINGQVKFLGYDSDYCMIFGIYGPNIQQKYINQLLNTIIYLIEQTFYMKNKQKNIVKNFKKQSTQGITFVYFNKQYYLNKSFCSKNTQISDQNFKHQIIKKLPLKYLCMINKIYIVYPENCILYKAIDFYHSYGLEGQFYDQYFTYVDSIYELVNHLGPLFEVNKVDRIFIKPSQNPKAWQIIFSDYQIKQAMKQFQKYQKFCNLLDSGTSIAEIIKYKNNIENYRLKDNNIPLILSILYQHILQNHLNHEKLFRLVPNEKKLLEFQYMVFKVQNQQKNLNEQQYLAKIKQIINTNKFSVQTYSSFIKRFISMLQKPLPFKINNIQLQENQLNLNLEQQVLHKPNYITFKKTIQFLQKVKNNQKVNRMSSKNLGIQFGPCFVRSRKNKIFQAQLQFELDLIYKMINIITKLIQNPTVLK